MPQKQLPSRSHAYDTQMLQRAINHGLEFVGVFNFSSFSQNNPRFFRIEPGRISIVFLRSTRLSDFHQESLDHILLHPASLPKNALRMNVNMEMPRLDNTECARLFFGFALGSLTMRQAWFGSPLGKRPLAASVGVDQEKLDMRIHSTVAHRSNLQR